MSKGKKFPPRVRIRHCKEGCSHIMAHKTMGVPYLSLEEHSRLLAKARREGRAEAFGAVLDAAQKIYEEDMESDPSDYFFTRQAVAKASEGASDEV